MTKEQIADVLLKQLNSDEDSTQVIIPREMAVAIVRMLTGQRAFGGGKSGPNGSVLFYCADCGTSFRANGREDKDCFQTYQYHTWYAACPHCKREVSQNDRYWR